ncbi:LutC/YkgG family protein [Ferrimonas lipolytica]|uniref:LUD domain-containing protein n=1 Tax=Ferrimonas lipolytica TaxID=2724191 RepID=A0A6H1UDH7_9GAMM|nr:LUD domain-containing protein [Ferrimonas lipolytica]QIZ77131.1 LUD domain-containing protein [Ferrimonas lipolytica]
MSSRDAILAALEKVKVPHMAMPKITIEPNNQDLAGQYLEMIAKVGGTAIEVTSLVQVQDYLNDKISANEQVLSLVDGVSGNRQLDAQQHDLHNVDLALVPAKFGVAENGAVYVSSQDTGHRVTPFIAENLAALLRRSDLVANMHEAVKQVELNSGELGSFIAGPSKTADIEQALVIGAHGACSMTIFLID